MDIISSYACIHLFGGSFHSWFESTVPDQGWTQMPWLLQCRPSWVMSQGWLSISQPSGRWIGTRSLAILAFECRKYKRRIAPTSADEVSTKYTNTTHNTTLVRLWWEDLEELVEVTWYPGGWLLGWWMCWRCCLDAMGPSMQVCQGLEEPWVVPPQMEGADMMGWWSFFQNSREFTTGNSGCFLKCLESWDEVLMT